MPPIPLPAERNALPVGNCIAEWSQVQAAAAAFGMPVDAWISMAIEAMRAKAPPMSNAEKQRAYRERAKVRAMGDATNVKVGASDAN